MSDIGATDSGLWQFWQDRCRIGSMSLWKVTAAGSNAKPASPDCPAQTSLAPAIPTTAQTINNVPSLLTRLMVRSAT